MRLFGHLILFDVWHHLEHPANALAEFRRVLVPKGRVILLEPAMSLVARLVYGRCHHEPLGFDTLLSDRLTDLNAPTAHVTSPRSRRLTVFLCNASCQDCLKLGKSAPFGLSLLLLFWDPASSAVPSFISKLFIRS